jgi:hypothetical protein
MGPATIVSWVKSRLRKADEQIKAARNLKGDGGRIGVDVGPDGATIKYLAAPEVEVVERTGALSGGVYPGKIWRWNGSAWVDTGATCEIRPL